MLERAETMARATASGAETPTVIGALRTQLSARSVFRAACATWRGEKMTAMPPWILHSVMSMTGARSGVAWVVRPALVTWPLMAEARMMSDGCPAVRICATAEFEIVTLPRTSAPAVA